MGGGDKCVKGKGGRGSGFGWVNQKRGLRNRQERGQGLARRQGRGGGLRFWHRHTCIKRGVAVLSRVGLRQAVATWHRTAHILSRVQGLVYARAVRTLTTSLHGWRWRVVAIQRSRARVPRAAARC